MEKRKRRAFSDEYKAEVVKLIVDGGRPLAQVCREMDLTPSAVRSWVRQANHDNDSSPEGALTESERDELRRLRKEVGQLRQEREILKKSVVDSTGRCNSYSGCFRHREYSDETNLYSRRTPTGF